MAGDFLPPDPYAPAPPASRPPAALQAFMPPQPAPKPPRKRADHAVAGLAIGSGALAVLVITAGALFVLTLPFSVSAWVLGSKAKHLAPEHPQANVAMLLGIVGTVLAVAAAAVIIATTPVD